MNNKLLSRKYILAVLSLASLSILCWFGKIDDSLYITGLTVTVGAYMTANVWQRDAA